MAGTQGSKFKVYMFNDDIEMIKKFVLSMPHDEIEGDMFGLRNDEDEPVVQLVLGPKQTSFTHELSTDNINRKLLREKFQLEYFGKWWYHPHQVRPAEPELQTGMLLLQISIDNESSSLELMLEPFRLKNEMERGKVEFLGAPGAFKRLKEIKDILEESCRDEKPWSDKSVNRERQESKFSTNRSFDSQNSDTFSAEEKMTLVYGPTTNTQLEFTATATQPFKVHMFQEDLEMMSNLVLRYPDLETGGELFGLWNTLGEPVVHIVLGPGITCRRTNVSFFQDVPYLERVGSLLTETYQLCHIGEWHSHHRLHLSQPSHGDTATIIRNYPSGVCGFLLMIANIISPEHVTISPYLYTMKSRVHYDLSGEVMPISGGSAFRKIRQITEEIERGEEVFRPQQRDSVFTRRERGAHSRQLPSFSRSNKPKWRN